MDKVCKKASMNHWIKYTAGIYGLYTNCMFVNLEDLPDTSMSFFLIPFHKDLR